MRLLTLLLTVYAVLLFAACSKKKENPTTPPSTTKSKKDLVVDGKWQWSAFAFVMNNNGKDSLVDAWSQVKDCDKDDIMTYSANGTGVIDEGATKCDPNAAQTKNITWELMNNETQVKVTDDKGTHLLTIVSLTATEAVYKQRVATGGDSITVQQTFKNVK